MSQILGTTGTSTLTASTALLQHPPFTADNVTENPAREESSNSNFGINNISGGSSGGDHPNPAISLQRLEFYNHSLATAFGEGGVSTATAVAPPLQPSPAKPPAAHVHSTVGIEINEPGDGGGWKLAPAASWTSYLGEVQSTPAIPAVSPDTITFSSPGTWSGVTAAPPTLMIDQSHSSNSAGGKGVEFDQNGVIGSQQQQGQQQQQWFGEGLVAGLASVDVPAMSTYYPSSSVPFPPPSHHPPQPALFQAPRSQPPGAPTANGCNGSANPTAPYHVGFLPASGQFPQHGVNSNGLGVPAGVNHSTLSTLSASTALPMGVVGLPTPAPRQQPSHFGAIPSTPMFNLVSTHPSYGGLTAGGGGGGNATGGGGGGGCLALSAGAGAKGIMATRNDDFGAGMNNGKAAGGPTLVALQQQQQLQTPAPMFTVSSPLQNVFAGCGGGVPGMPQMMVHPAVAAAAAAAAGVPPIPLPVNAFLQLNPLYPGLRLLLGSPTVYVVDDFFTAAECDALMALADNYMIISPVVGAGAGEISESRTSSSCFLAREDLPTVCSKVMALTGKPLEHLELPQVGRYYTTQKYANHWDAFDLNTEDGRRFAQNGGQRVCTVLVYLNDVSSGGCTSFPRLGLRVQPRKGMAVVFFPATLGGTLDPMLLHAAEPAIDTKWVSQIWIRQGTYHGTPTARIPRI